MNILNIEIDKFLRLYFFYFIYMKILFKFEYFYGRIIVLNVLILIFCYRWMILIYGLG